MTIERGWRTERGWRQSGYDDSSHDPRRLRSAGEVICLLRLGSQGCAYTRQHLLQTLTPRAPWVGTGPSKGISPFDPYADRRRGDVLQQTCGSVGRVLPAVLAPLIILELHADPSWVGVYFGLTAIAALIGQLGSGGFIIRHGAIRMSQVALLSTGGGMVAIIGGAAGFVLSALVGNSIAAVATPASSQLLGRWSIRRYAVRILGHAHLPFRRAFCSAAGSVRLWLNPWGGAARC